MDPHADDVLGRAAPPPDDTRPYAAGPAQVYDVRFPPGRVPAPSSAQSQQALPESSAQNLQALPESSAQSQRALPESSAQSQQALPESTAQNLRSGTVLVVHGGFWRAEYDRSHAAAQAAGLAEAGWHVAVGEYRRAGMPGGGVPGTLDDVEALVAAVLADPDLPGPLVLLGHSAGGHLVAWAANQPWAGALAGAVVLAGCVDLGATDRMELGGGAARLFVGGPPAEVPDRWLAADPMSSLPPRCPVRLVHGELDREVPVTVTDAYVARATELGADVTLDVVPDAGHYSVIDPETPAWPHVLRALANLRAPHSE